MPAESAAADEPGIGSVVGGSVVGGSVVGGSVVGGSVVGAVVRYTALRLALMAALSVLVWLIGVPWLAAVAVGVVLATVVSLTLLRASTRRLSEVLAAASARNRAARPSLADSTDGDRPDDLYDVDPYADDDPDADNGDEAADAGHPAEQQRAVRVEQNAQDARINASPTSRP